MSRNRRLSSIQQQEVLAFLHSNNVHSVGCYTLHQTLGEGSFGKVRLATHQLTGQKVAIKIVDKKHTPALVREIETWRQLQHPNIVQLYECIPTETKIYMVSEYCSGGELFEYISKTGRMEDTDINCKRVVKQLFEAVHYCHSKGLTHRDLKLENVMLLDGFVIKLIDFGFTTHNDNGVLLETFCGSSAYASPEVVSGKKYSGPESDVWALGVMFYTIVCGELPFDDENENDAVIHKKIMTLDYAIPEELSPGCQDLIQKILRLEPSSRPKIGEILQHEWFPSMSESRLEQSFQSTLEPNKDDHDLAWKLKGLGLDVASILESVACKKCDNLSAFWQLLLKSAPKTGRRISATEKNQATTGSFMLTGFRTNSSSNMIDSNIKKSFLSIADFSGELSINESKEIDAIFLEAKRKAAMLSENPILSFSRRAAAENAFSNSAPPVLGTSGSVTGSGEGPRQRRSSYIDAAAAIVAASGFAAKEETKATGARGRRASFDVQGFANRGKSQPNGKGQAEGSGFTPLANVSSRRELFAGAMKVNAGQASSNAAESQSLHSSSENTYEAPPPEDFKAQRKSRSSQKATRMPAVIQETED